MSGAVFSYAVLAVFQRSSMAEPTRATFYGAILMTISYAFIALFDASWVSIPFYLHFIIFALASIKTFAYYALTKGCSLCQPTIAGLLFLLEIPGTYILEMILL